MSHALPLYRFHACLQQELFPTLQENLDDLSEPMRQLATVISATKSDLPPNILWDSPYLPGRPRKSRQAILNAFIAKAIFNMLGLAGNSNPTSTKSEKNLGIKSPNRVFFEIDSHVAFQT